MRTQIKILHFLAFLTLVASGPYIRNCLEVKERGVHNVSLDEESRPFEVLCDGTILDGGWTVVMNRSDGRVEFGNRHNESYKFGFGDFSYEFFLGLDQLNALTSDRPHMVLFMMKDFKDKQYVATYDVFEVRDETFHYSTGDLTFAHSGLDMGFTKFNVFCNVQGRVQCENRVPGWQLNPYAEPKGLTTKSSVQLFGFYPHGENDTKLNNFGIFYREDKKLVPLKSLIMMIRPFSRPSNYKKPEKLTNELDRRFFGTHSKCVNATEAERNGVCKYAIV